MESLENMGKSLSWSARFSNDTKNDEDVFILSWSILSMTPEDGFSPLYHKFYDICVAKKYLLDFIEEKVQIQEFQSQEINSEDFDKELIKTTRPCPCTCNVFVFDAEDDLNDIKNILLDDSIESVEKLLYTLKRSKINSCNFYNSSRRC
jgi:hypothetical protein